MIFDRHVNLKYKLEKFYFEFTILSGFSYDIKYMYKYDNIVLELENYGTIKKNFALEQKYL